MFQVGGGGGGVRSAGRPILLVLDLEGGGNQATGISGGEGGGFVPKP